MSDARRGSRRGRGKGNKDFLFVSGDPSGKQDPEERKTIRSHVMRGKNTRQGPISRDGPLATLLPSMPLYSRATSGEYSPGDSRVTCGLDNANFPIRIPIRGQRTDWAERVARYRGLLVSIPASANDFTLFPFCEDVNMQERAMMFAYFTNIQQALHPLEPTCCIDQASIYFIQWLQYDVAYMHSVLYVASTFFDIVNHKPSRKATNYHFYKLVKALNERLSDNTAAVSDSTVTTITSMVMVALCVHDLVAARTHLDGLRRIVQLRGGIEAFNHNPKLQEKLYGADLGYALGSGEGPFFHPATLLANEPALNVSLARNAITPYLIAAFSRSYAIVHDLDPALGEVLRDMQHLSVLANMSATESGGQVDTTEFRDVLISAQYRLVNLRSAEGSLTELCRLGLVAFLTTIMLRLPGYTLKYPFVAIQLQTHLQDIEPSTPEEGHIYVWTLAMAMATVTDISKMPHLREKALGMIQTFAGAHWPEVQEQLTHFLWIGAVHDRPFIKALKECMSGSDLERFHVDVG